MSLRLFFDLMVSKDSIWKFVKSERFIIVWWNVQWIGSLFILGWHHPGKLLVDIWLIVSIACYVLGINRMKKLGAISLALYSCLTIMFAGAMALLEYEYIFIHGHSLGFAALFVILLLLVALTNLVIAFRTLRILSKLDDDVEVEGW